MKVRIEDVDLDSNRMRLSMREGGFGGGPRAPVDLTPFENLSCSFIGVIQDKAFGWRNHHVETGMSLIQDLYGPYLWSDNWAALKFQKIY